MNTPLDVLDRQINLAKARRDDHLRNLSAHSIRAEEEMNHIGSLELIRGALALEAENKKTGQ